MEEGDEQKEDVFEIGVKERNPEALLRWRRATLVLNASRRFRYTAAVQRPGSLDGSANPLSPGASLGRSRSQSQHSQQDLTPAQRFRKSGHVLMAVNRFKQAGKMRQSRFGDLGDGFGLTAEQLVELNSAASVEKLGELGGAFEVCRALRVHPDTGISTSEEEVEKRRAEYGTNTYPPAPSKSWLMFAFEAAQDKTLIILMVCGIISLIAGTVSDPSQGWYDGVAIAAAVILVVLVTATSDYVQSLQFKGLSAEKANIQLKVLRDGRMQVDSIFSLLVGDIIPLNIGDQVPADGLLVSSHSLVIDESSMTGESEPVHKGPQAPFMLSGCKVSDGVGTMVVTAVGINTEWGKVAATLNQEEDSETPLQVRLNGLATGIGKLGLVMATLILIVLLIYYGVEYTPKSPIQVVKDVTDILIIAITIIVVAVPEGLPLAVTLTLAYSMSKMMADKALVRRLSACETMGCATTICSDKTGTLTLNQMTAVEEFVGGVLQKCEAANAPGGLLWEVLCEGVSQNGTGSVFITQDGSPEVSASPTEAAVITWLLKLGLDFNAKQKESSIVGVETFNSTKKRGGVTVLLEGGAARVHWKGAAEIILGLCSSWMTQEGQKQALDEDMVKKAEEAITSMASRSLRCVGLAYRELQEQEKQETDVGGVEKSLPVPDDKLCLLAIVGIKDPCRPGVPQAVYSCQGAGVKVRMVTGDNALTARAIAGECGILTPHGRIIEGKDFRALSKEQIYALLPSIDVMARSSPTDKHLLVQSLRQMGEVVAVTGDGTNDAPALKEADIGLSMGISGTEVAKESSDIVILDDNFASIVKVVRWGRAVFANIQKFIQFQLTVNIAALVIDFVVACTPNAKVPLTAVQLLWINLIMDTLAALALATEPPTDDLMQQKPNGRKAPLITNYMWRNILLMSIYQIAVLLVLFYAGLDLLHLRYNPDGSPNTNGTTTLNTVIFNAFVFCQLFNEINARKPDKFNVFKGLFRNPLFIGVVLVSAAFQVVMVEVLHAFANTVSLSWQLWIFCIIVGAVSIPLAFLFKLIPVPKTPFLTLLHPKRWFRRRGLAASMRSSMPREEADADMSASLQQLQDISSPTAQGAAQSSTTNSTAAQGTEPSQEKCAETHSNGINGMIELPKM